MGSKAVDRIQLAQDMVQSLDILNTSVLFLLFP
jgi:hypothetical protein